MPPKDVLPPAIIWLLTAVTSLGLLAALLLAIKAWRKPPLLAYEPRRPVPWGANDLVATLLFVLVLGYIAGQIVTRIYAGLPAEASTAADFYANSAVEICGMAIGIALVWLQAGATLADLGFSTAYLWRDLWIGTVALLATVAPIVGLQALLETWFPYKHPLIEAIRAHPDAQTLLATAFAALVAAPLFEEFLFRVLLQGWLEAIEFRRRTVRLGIPGDGPAWWPILVSSLFFSMMHLGQGAASIPLFFLALVLGYLYQRTHRIWPSLVAHFLLNAGSMVVLWCQIHHASA